jgi:poly-gamma-glutamate synthesis protein (capsule biosynthesis protein)
MSNFKFQWCSLLRVSALIGFGVVLSVPYSNAAPAEESLVSIAFVGDVMLADTPGKLIARGRDPLTAFGPLLKQADLRVANLECVVATVGEAEVDKPWTFRAHPRTLKIVQRHFDAVGLANNHSGDFGPQAFGQMLGLLQAHGIGYFGGGHNLAESHRPLIIERKGLRIALLGYNEFFPRSFEAGLDNPGVAWSEDEQVVLDIRTARRKYSADVVIPVMHWGWEHEPLASARQHALARLMIDAGADAVVGGHPHVNQDVEHYQGKPIVFSLGNFVFDGFDSKPTTTGWLLQLDVDKNGAKSWKIFVAKIDRNGSPKPQSRHPAMCWSKEHPDSTECP